MRYLIILLSCLVLTACGSYEPLEPQAADEIPDGPGLLTGEDGKFTVYRKK